MAGGKGYSIQFDVSGLAEAMDVLANMSDTVQKASSGYISQLASRAKDVVQSETPKDSGALANSTKSVQKSKYKYEIVQTQTSGAGRKTPNYFYGRGVRMGTRGDYYIRPRLAQAIYWPKKKGSTGLSRPIPWVGSPYTAFHPGIQRPYNYVDASIQRLQSDIQSVARSIAANVQQEAFKRFRTRSV